MNVDVVVVGKCDSILDGGSVVNPRPRASRVGGTSLNYLGWVGGRTKTLLRCRGTDGEGPTGSAANDASLSGLLCELVVWPPREITCTRLECAVSASLKRTATLIG